VFDQADVGGGMSQGRAPLGARHLLDPGGYANAGAEIESYKNDASRGRGRPEAESDRRPGQIADTVEFNGPGDGPLVAVTKPSHVRVFLDFGLTADSLPRSDEVGGWSTSLRELGLSTRGAS